MADEALKQEILRQLEHLPPSMQRRVLLFSKSLVETKPKGVKGSDLLRFAGQISGDDAGAMSKAIDEGCEQVDSSEW